MRLRKPSGIRRCVEVTFSGLLLARTSTPRSKQVTDRGRPSSKPASRCRVQAGATDGELVLAGCHRPASVGAEGSARTSGLAPSSAPCSVIHRQRSDGFQLVPTFSCRRPCDHAGLRSAGRWHKEDACARKVKRLTHAFLGLIERTGRCVEVQTRAAPRSGVSSPARLLASPRSKRRPIAWRSTRLFWGQRPSTAHRLGGATFCARTRLALRQLYVERERQRTGAVRVGPRCHRTPRAGCRRRHYLRSRNKPAFPTPEAEGAK